MAGSRHESRHGVVMELDFGYICYHALGVMKTCDFIEWAEEPLDAPVLIDNTDELMRHFGIYRDERED